MASVHLKVVGKEVPAVPVHTIDYDYEKWLDDLRGAVWHAHNKRNRNFEIIAAEAGLCTTTVVKFAWRDTKRPALLTAFKLARAVGFRVAIVHAGAQLQQDELATGTYSEHIPTTDRRKP